MIAEEAGREAQPELEEVGSGAEVLEDVVDLVLEEDFVVEMVNETEEEKVDGETVGFIVVGIGVGNALEIDEVRLAKQLQADEILAGELLQAERQLGNPVPSIPGAFVYVAQKLMTAGSERMAARKQLS